jgi:Alpha amylase, catalytic domain
MTQKAPNNGWWRGGVIHQIYPRSYQDTNADGIGDLPGITRRLDHIAALGTDGIWLSPFFKSPMKDFGYDVSDHCDVDPMFGTLDDFKALVSRAHALGVGEIGDHDGLARVAEYTSGGDKLHMTYCFDLLNDSHDAPYLQGVLSRFLSVVGDGWPCWALSNHDCVRSATRWGGTDPDPRLLRLMAAFQVSLRGSVCLYQGEELGLPEANVPFEDLREPYGINMWPEFKGRDGCRTPMPWASTEPQAGFSAAKPWLPPLHRRTRPWRRTHSRTNPTPCSRFTPACCTGGGVSPRWCTAIWPCTLATHRCWPTSAATRASACCACSISAAKAPAGHCHQPGRPPRHTTSAWPQPKGKTSCWCCNPGEVGWQRTEAPPAAFWPTTSTPPEQSLSCQKLNSATSASATAPSPH